MTAASAGASPAEVKPGGAGAVPSGQNRQSPASATGPGPGDTTAGEQFVPVVFTHKDEATAVRVFADLQQKYPTVLKRRKSEVQPVEIENKGTWHRLVVLPAGSRRQADALCAQLTAAGYDRCWVKAY
jgi:SPOR domain